MRRLRKWSQNWICFDVGVVHGKQWELKNLRLVHFSWCLSGTAVRFRMLWDLCLICLFQVCLTLLVELLFLSYLFTCYSCHSHIAEDIFDFWIQIHLNFIILRCDWQKTNSFFHLSYHLHNWIGIHIIYFRLCLRFRFN